VARPAAVKTSRRVKTGADGGREALGGSSRPVPSHSAGVASDNGGSVKINQVCFYFFLYLFF